MWPGLGKTHIVYIYYSSTETGQGEVFRAAEIRVPEFSGFCLAFLPEDVKATLGFELIASDYFVGSSINDSGCNFLWWLEDAPLRG